MLHLSESNMVKRNWFPTLNETLASEGLQDTWDGIMMPAMAYSETRGYTFDDGSRYGH